MPFSECLINAEKINVNFNLLEDLSAVLASFLC